MYQVANLLATTRVANPGLQLVSTSSPNRMRPLGCTVPFTLVYAAKYWTEDN